MLQFLSSIFARSHRDRPSILRIQAMRADFAGLSDHELKTAAAQAKEFIPFAAATAVIASRVLRLDMFDVQLMGAVALARGSIAEMKTGEGKTLAAVPAVAWYACSGQGVHVMTANDYLAHRDAAWMGGIYRFLGLSVAHVGQGMTIADAVPPMRPISLMRPPTRSASTFFAIGWRFGVKTRCTGHCLPPSLTRPIPS